MDLCLLLQKILTDPEIKELEILHTVPPEVSSLIASGRSSDVYDSRFYPLVVVRSESIVGIPKSILISAFAYARVQFYPLANRPGTWAAEEADVVNATTIAILLVGSENLTAINARRRLLAQSHVSVADEFRLNTIMLTSRLQKHSKSPVLWNHRAHILQAMEITNIEELCTYELKTAMVAGEHHPMNYYSWTHARHVFSHIYRHRNLKYLQHTVQRMQKWCFAHAGDASAWSFFRYILMFYASLSRTQLDDAVVLSKIAETVQFATTVSLAHASVWGFIRDLVSDGRYVSARRRDAFVRSITAYLTSREHDRYKASTEKEERDVVVLHDMRDKDVNVVTNCLLWMDIFKSTDP